MLHQTSLSPAVRRVEQSEEMERSVTQLEWRVRGELMGIPVKASQTCKYQVKGTEGGTQL